MNALSAIEIRVLGVLLEKAVTTPDQYPLTLNAIVSACNQKSSRDPVMHLSDAEVQRALRTLEDKLLVSADPNLRGRVEKYMQRFCKPPFGVYEFDDAQYAVLTVLMLRGPATPGELRTRTDRMYKFADNQAVLETLKALQNWSPDPVVTELSREPNRRDSCWAQLFGQATAPAESLKAASEPSGEALLTKAPQRAEERIDELEQRVDQLESALAEIRTEMQRDIQKASSHD